MIRRVLHSKGSYTRTGIPDSYLLAQAYIPDSGLLNLLTVLSSARSRIPVRYTGTCATDYSDTWIFERGYTDTGNLIYWYVRNPPPPLWDKVILPNSLMCYVYMKANASHC